MEDEDVMEIGNVENVCRLCLSVDEPRSSVFAQDREEDPSSVSLAAKIQACLSIQISPTDKLSTLICANCVKNVNQWHTYKESCLRSQDKLQEWLATQSQSNPTVITIKDEPMDVDYEDNVEIISETTNNLEQAHSPIQTVENKETDNKEVQKIDENDANDTHKENDSETVPSATEMQSEKDQNQIDQQDTAALCSIKIEPQDDDDTDCTIEVESANDSELLLNPMAVSTKEDTVMEADSTQKSNAASSPPKKKFRRGPHTHFRGTRVVKKKCTHCQIFLHSKYSYIKHMQRFHSKENGGIENLESISQNDDEEMVEDLEDELVSMEKDSPLTQVQQEIISQLKTFSCYSCEQTFNDRRSTLSHIRQHLPDLRPYTCIACLTEFPDRSMYQLHCGASFECAMKIALVVPKHGNERYFTCNMCLRSMRDRKELLSHLSKHSDKQYEEMMSPARAPPKLKPMAPLPSEKSSSDKTKTVSGPYKNGDPAHNHVCDLCGMIYRYRPNMVRHREFCMRLLPENRTSYKCAHCSMTFLVFKKFHTHITVDHKKKEFTCVVCNSKFRSPSDYLTHHENHRAATHDGNRQTQDTSRNEVQAPLKERNAYRGDANPPKSRLGSQKYSCALCTQEFSTRTELTEHRNLHLKVKIYSCAICRSMFSSPGALEIHMKDHGIEDPNERNANISCVEYGNLDEDVRIDEKDSMNASAVSDPGTKIHECSECGKVMSNYANLRRHTKIAHRNAKIYDCYECSRMFTRKEMYDHHMQLKHKSKAMLQCPQCPKSFVFQSNFTYHFRTAHLEKSQNGYACDICGKVFVEEASLKIHKGWHNRANSRLSTRFILGNQKASNNELQMESVSGESGENSERPARARKSFPNPPLQSATTSSEGNFQCQVCNDKFNDVTELRNHLWDVHCARNKPEKNFCNDELQCELCTNVFPDQETLASHMHWHKANPILSDIRKAYSCDVCGKSYSSKKVLWKHKKLHKATVVASIKFQSLARKPMASQFLCNFCRKVFSSGQSLQRHKLSFHNELQSSQRTQQQLYNSNRKLSYEDEPRPKRMKLEIDDDNPPKLPPFAMDFAGERRKPVMCHLCKKMFPNMSVLYKHKQTTHKHRARKDVIPECIPMSTQDGKFSCNICFKEFPGLSNLRQHFTIKHKKGPRSSHPPSNSDATPERPIRPTKEPESPTHNNILFSCKLCKQCHVFNKEAIINHITTVHNAVYQADSRTFHREVNLGGYVVKGAIGATCPRCNVKYPNNRALKIHYIKFHENAD
ncbi:zinc finger protein 836 [Camponotus floridanus]|uniref:zinc finger protein 836 n=1 Tax=Camponotus floridanus TaxID=104421 RepID=UPI000DC67F35|nr:zinc finger protein 836 [Camponotus floridanus]